MGIELSGTATPGAAIPVVPWLEPSANRFLRRYVLAAAAARADVDAVILFGSAARGEMRPLTDLAPSDIDVLFLVTTSNDGQVTAEQRLAIARAEVAAYPEVFDESLRPVQTVIADLAFTGWDSSFVKGVARDGLLLWSRRTLPATLAAVAHRTTALLDAQELSQRETYRYPSGEPITEDEEAEIERLAQELGTSRPYPSEMMSEDRGPR